MIWETVPSLENVLKNKEKCYFRWLVLSFVKKRAGYDFNWSLLQIKDAILHLNFMMPEVKEMEPKTGLALEFNELQDLGG